MVEPAQSAPKVRRPWPTSRVFWNLALAMIGFGMLVAVILRLSLLSLGMSAEKLFRPEPFRISVIAGLVVGFLNYRLVSRVVRHRLHVVSARLLAARSDIANCVGTDSWEPLAPRYALPLYCQDEFGRTAAAFNYLLNALDTSEQAERDLRQSLIEQAKLAA